MSSDLDFLKGLDLADKLVRGAVVEGKKRACMQLLDDAINEAPLIPHDEGTLQGSGSVFVNDELVGTAPNVGGDPTPATSHQSGGSADEVVGTVGFNVPYAAFQHEGQREDGSHVVTQHSRPDGRGSKYLERPLHENAEDYVAIEANTVRKALRGGGRGAVA